MFWLTKDPLSPMKPLIFPSKLPLLFWNNIDCDPFFENSGSIEWKEPSDGIFIYCLPPLGISRLMLKLPISALFGLEVPNINPGPILKFPLFSLYSLFAWKVFLKNSKKFFDWILELPKY